MRLTATTTRSLNNLLPGNDNGLESRQSQWPVLTQLIGTVGACALFFILFPGTIIHSYFVSITISLTDVTATHFRNANLILGEVVLGTVAGIEEGISKEQCSTRIILLRGACRERRVAFPLASHVPERHSNSRQRTNPNQLISNRVMTSSSSPN